MPDESIVIDVKLNTQDVKNSLNQILTEITDTFATFDVFKDLDFLKQFEKTLELPSGILSGIITLLPTIVGGLAYILDNLGKVSAEIQKSVDKTMEQTEKDHFAIELSNEKTAAQEKERGALAAKSESIRTLVKDLRELQMADSRSVDDQKKMAENVNRLNGLIPELNLSYDAQANSLSTSTDAMLLQIDAMAGLEKHTTALEQREAIWAEQNNIQALIEAQEARGKLLKSQWDELTVYSSDNLAGWELAAGVSASIEDVEALKTALDEEGKSIKALYEERTALATQEQALTETIVAYEEAVRNGTDTSLAFEEAQQKLIAAGYTAEEASALLISTYNQKATAQEQEAAQLQALVDAYSELSGAELLALSTGTGLEAQAANMVLAMDGVAQVEALIAEGTNLYNEKLIEGISVSEAYEQTQQALMEKGYTEKEAIDMLAGARAQQAEQIANLAEEYSNLTDAELVALAAGEGMEAQVASTEILARAQEEALAQVTSSLQNYAEIAGNAFSGVPEKVDLSMQDMIDNLAENQAALATWTEDLGTIAESGAFSNEFIAQLEGMGLAGRETVAEIADDISSDLVDGVIDGIGENGEKVLSDDLVELLNNEAAVTEQAGADAKRKQAMRKARLAVQKGKGSLLKCA